MKNVLHIKDIVIIILICALLVMSSLYFVHLSQSKNNNLEIERKFLLDLDKLPTDMASRSDVTFEFVQTYINYSPEMRVRSINNIEYCFTIKFPKDDRGLSREEIEFLITEEEYNELLKKQVGATIYKTRYQFYEEGTLITVDVYSHDLTGLAVAEVEFKNVKQAERYNPPEWFGKDITSDNRYKNASLARHGMPQD